MSHMKHVSLALRAVTALAIAAAVNPAAIVAQPTAVAVSVPRTSLWVGAGTYNSDIDSDGYLPLFVARADRSLGRFLLADLGVGVTSGARRFDYDGRDAGGRPVNPREVRAPLATLDVQLQAQLPLGRFRPYIGVGGGLFSNVRGTFDTPAFVRPTASAAGGARIDLTRRVGVRAELRFRHNTYRFDSYAGPYTSMANDFEQTAGLFWRF